MRITKVGVVGAGAMGAGIAALAASAGLPVVLLDIPGSDDPNARDRSKPARDGLDRARRAKPPAFLDDAAAARITTGNTEDHLDLLADCSWICEAIIEKPAPKQALFARLESVAPTAIVSSNTSGIPMEVLLEGRTKRFRKRFLGTHYFNPPRYMHLLEIIPTPETAKGVLEAMRALQERTLGKGIVIAKDVPGFVANRLGVHGMVIAGRLMIEHELTIPEVDTLTGELIGRARTATFRTGDLTGLDVLVHVTSGLSQATGEDLELASFVHEIVKFGSLGDKTKAGFYKKEGGTILALDWNTLEYRDMGRYSTSEIDRITRLPAPERIRAARDLPDRQGDFLRELLVEQFHYACTLAPSLAYDVAAVDRAMEWGYGWELGPFRAMDAVGLDWVRDAMRKAGKDVPALLERAGDAFYADGPKGETVLSIDSAARTPVPVIAGQVSLKAIKRKQGKGGVLKENDEARILDLGDGVLCLEFCGKFNTLGPGVMDLADWVLDTIADGPQQGLVIGNEDARTFTAGANLKGVAQLVQAGEWKTLDAIIRRFQDTVMALRHSPFPVVAAPFGLTLGGGCEISLHCDRVQAHAELYMGLVEAGVGVIPGGGGTKELAFRFTKALAPYEGADPFEGIKRAFKLIALAQTSTSAQDARAMGFLRPVADRITMNRDLLIADAKARVLDLAPGYVAPTRRTMRSLGRAGIGNLEYALWAFREAGQASEHDVRIGRELAIVLAGGDGPAREVTEQDLLDLERDAFLRLLGTKETQARIRTMLETGKPLRN
ncbi:MAG TPA: 3-hydroxyacyl-CoA dehydrogenase NAD-binding domain-containing protein [Gemmatimonadaceae bacterium]|nr:3-hydroxyacyl-CoA dehydrogenase NAD-binding domain-containing protein [Gemmatimonadaceae bacterium]